MNTLAFSRRALLAASGLVMISGRGAWGAADPVAETTAGKVRGRSEGGVHVFKAIPYGDTTAGANRFMAPKPPKPWAGIRDCFEYGPQTPQGTGPAVAPAPAPQPSRNAPRPTVWRRSDALHRPAGASALDTVHQHGCDSHG